MEAGGDSLEPRGPAVGARPRLTGATAVVAGWAALAVGHAATLPSGRAKVKPWVAATMQGYTAGYALAMAAAMGAIVLGVERANAPRRAVRAALVAASLAFGVAFLRDDTAGLAGRSTEAMPALFAVADIALAALAGLGIGVAVLAGRLLAWPYLRFATLAAAGGAGWVNGTNLRYSYEGVHLLAAVAAASFAAAALAGAPWPERLDRVGNLKRAPLALLVSCAILGAPALFIVPPNEVLVELSRRPAAFLAPFPIVRADDVTGTATIPSDLAAWFAPRKDAAEVSPSRPAIAPDDPIVLMIGIDSMRADVLENESNRGALPGLFRLRDESAWFANARSPGTSTAPALAAIFASAYYSQQYWVTHPKRPAEPFPHLDEAPRFPELLQGAGVHTLTVDSAGWLLNEFGIVRGFSDERTLRGKGESYPPAREVLAALSARLAEAPSNRVFAFAHLLDAHAPYTSVKTTGTAEERYVAELSGVDAALRRLRSDLERQRLWQRTVTIVYSDHGEAFGEHGLTFHGQSLYDELLRVPLLVRVPYRAPRRIDAAVSLIDLGPTVLDLFDVATPGAYMGETLLSLLRDPKAKLSRPIIGEARLKRSLVLPSGTKIVHDTRFHTVELFDLAEDPGEERNLFDDDDPASVDALLVLEAFFEAHTLRKPGYRVPFRKW